MSFADEETGKVHNETNIKLRCNTNLHDRILRGFDFFGQVFSSSISLVEFLDTVLLCYLPQSQIEENHDQVCLLEDIVQGLAEHFGVESGSF